MGDEPRAADDGAPPKTADDRFPVDGGFDDDAGKSMLADLEPSKLVARTLFEHAPVAMLMVDRAGEIQHVNNATEKLFGYSKDALVGQVVEILVHPDARQRHEKLREGFMVHPTARSMAEGRRLSALRKDGTEISVEIAINPVVMEASDVALILSVIDNSVRERADRAEFFVKELTHRARNMFAIISAISRQIAKHSTSIAEFQVALDHRLNALSTSYQVFEKENWQAAPVRDLVRSQIAFVVKQGSPQIALNGPEVRLRSTPAEYLGLAVHELATNAVKHGALSVPTGAVTVNWAVDETAKKFEFHWVEHDGPPVIPSERQGFGSAILKTIVPSACEGTAELAVTPAGMSWSLNAPLAMLAQAE
jgi:PAS domain S-box-containing protein